MLPCSGVKPRERRRHSRRWRPFSPRRPALRLFFIFFFIFIFFPLFLLSTLCRALFLFFSFPRARAEVKDREDARERHKKPDEARERIFRKQDNSTHPRRKKKDQAAGVAWWLKDACLPLFFGMTSRCLGCRSPLCPCVESDSPPRLHYRYFAAP